MTPLRAAVMMLVLAVAGLAGAAYVLVNERAPVPFRDVYDVRATLRAADGVAPGLGQPVHVAGVKVGMISEARLVDGRAEVTLQIERGELPRVYRDARASLRPITPLEDMRIELDPGTPQAGPLDPGQGISSARTTTPAALDELLGALDADTREFLASLITALDGGTRGRAPDMRRALRALGTTTPAFRRVARAVAARDDELRRLVTAVARVTEAAAADEQLARVVRAGHTTLAAIAREDGALDAALAALPGTLRTTDRSLTGLRGLMAELTPALRELRPVATRLPGTFDELGSFSRITTRTLRAEVTPLARRIPPVLDRLGGVAGRLATAAPDLTGVLLTANHVLNELAYNPPGDDEGFHFWVAWFAHNWNSLMSTVDAHGGIGRAMVMVNCGQLTQVGDVASVLRLLLGVTTTCPD